ncbi:MAG TPA: transporter [Verrucomicrobiae bacterium]
MKHTKTIALGVACGVLAFADSLQAQHYPAGSEGLKAATLPPPGFYFRDYNQFYFANDFEGGPPGFDVTAYVNAPRLIWITDLKILGASYGMDALIPLGYVDISSDPGGPNKSRFSFGDVCLEPATLSWHTKQFDVALAYAVWAPTGDDDLAGLGAGFWSHMLTAGATWYVDQDKTWSVSALNRYEINHERKNFTVGDTWTLEWGIGKAVSKTVEVGVVGYYQAQVTDDDPKGGGGKPHVAAIGPEVSAFFPKLGMFASLRYLCEFAANNDTEGHLFTLTLTKPL